MSVPSFQKLKKLVLLVYILFWSAHTQETLASAACGSRQTQLESKASVAIPGDRKETQQGLADRTRFAMRSICADLDNTMLRKCLPPPSQPSIAGLNLNALRREFDLNGFVVLRQYLNSASVAELREHVDAAMCDHTDFNGVRKGLEKSSDWFKQQLERGDHLPLIAALLLDKPSPASAAFFDKPIGKSTDISPHIDGMGQFDGATLWIALDRADRANGCLWYVRGSHHRSFSKESLSSLGDHSEGATPIEVLPGDAVIHSANIVHWSRASSVVNRGRRAISYFYWSASSLKTMPKQLDHQGIEEKSFELIKKLDYVHLEAALNGLNREWARNPDMIELFRIDPENFLKGLKSKDIEAYGFILGRALKQASKINGSLDVKHIAASLTDPK